jgi:integrase
MQDRFTSEPMRCHRSASVPTDASWWAIRPPEDRWQILSLNRVALLISSSYADAASERRAPHPRAPHSGEVEALMEAAKANRHGHRDATMILVAFRHGLRAAELCDLRWDQVEFAAAAVHVRRVKNGTPSTHPLRGDELRALRRLQRESETSPFVFVRSPLYSMEYS